MSAEFSQARGLPCRYENIAGRGLAEDRLRFDIHYDLTIAVATKLL